MSKRPRFAVKFPVLPLFLTLLAGCGGGGAYNFARNYDPLRAEKAFAEKATRASFEDVRRDPNGFADKTVAWFGVVKEYADLRRGGVRLVLSQRLHQARHLCKDERSSSCRVTVSEKSMGDFTIDMQLTPEQKEGKERIWFASLLKIYGSPTGEYDADGNPVLKVEFFRHWPRGYYVTTAARTYMRR